MQFRITKEQRKIADRIIDLLAEENYELKVAEEVLGSVVKRIRASSLVQDSSHPGYMPDKVCSSKNTENPFNRLPFRLDVGVD